jgi:hypothetical protein
MWWPRKGEVKHGEWWMRPGNPDHSEFREFFKEYWWVILGMVILFFILDWV